MVADDFNKVFSNSKVEQQNYFPAQICTAFRDTINSSPIFSSDKQYLSKYNLSCAVMDRLDTCIAQLNKYSDYPDSEEDFLIFMMFACMVVDAVKQLLAAINIAINITEPKENRKFFEEIYINSPVFNPEASIPTDDKFFEYIRSLIFAHPFETSRPKFLKKDEIQYSPWVIANRTATSFFKEKEKDMVGVRIYTNQSQSIYDLLFPFSTLKEYVLSKYVHIKTATSWAEEQIENMEKEWKKTKVNQKQSPIQILKEIDSILNSRHVSCYSICDFIAYLGCSLSCKQNTSAVEKFTAAIVACIPELCNAVENLDHEQVEEICYRILEYPNKMHKMAHYQLEKIFNYLGEKSSGQNKNWAILQAKHFSEEFAQKWVHIDTEAMTPLEIELLIRTACYLERQEQEATS